MTQAPFVSSVKKRYDPRKHTIRPIMPKKIRNFLLLENAEDLARELNAFWHEKGYHRAEWWPVEIPGCNIGGHYAHGYGVKSNLRNGLPPELQDCIPLEQEMPHGRTDH